MSRVGLGRASLIAAGIATSAMGAFHFVLPQLFGWAPFLHPLPAELRWALIAMNAFLSLLLLIGGLANLWVARRRGPQTALPQVAMVTFWTFNARYQLLRPFPTPGVRWALLGFAVANAALYTLALWAPATAYSPACLCGA